MDLVIDDSYDVLIPELCSALSASVIIMTRTCQLWQHSPEGTASVSSQLTTLAVRNVVV